MARRPSTLEQATAKRNLSRRSQHAAGSSAHRRGWKASTTPKTAVAPHAGAHSPERVMAELQPLLTADTIVAADASYSSMWVVGQLRALAPNMRFLTPRGLAGLGWVSPGDWRQVAAPHSPVVALVGDGGFAHSWAELETAVRSRIAVTVIVLNNGVLGYQKDAEDGEIRHLHHRLSFCAGRSCGNRARLRLPGDPHR